LSQNAWPILCYFSVTVLISTGAAQVLDYYGVVEVWIHALIDLLWLTLDVAWWIIVMRWTRKPLWRILASIFILLQAAEVLNELVGRLGMNRVDLSHVPKPLITEIVIWHFFGLATFIALGFAYAGNWLIQRLRTKHKQQASTVAPAGQNPVSRREFINACALV
jgi:hypothetical protein